MSTKPNPMVSQTKPINVADIPVTNPHGVQPIYANSIGLAATLMDFTLLFLETGQLPGEKGPTTRNELKAAVTLPMPAAGALIQVLNQYLTQNKAQMESAMAAAGKVEASSAKQ